MKRGRWGWREGGRDGDGGRERDEVREEGMEGIKRAQGEKLKGAMYGMGQRGKEKRKDSKEERKKAKKKESKKARKKPSKKV